MQDKTNRVSHHFLIKKENTLATENKAKATLLNLQFQSVFSQLSPLRLGQLCIVKIQELFENIPQNLKC